jgi:hypothetical protein
MRHIFRHTIQNNADLSTMVFSREQVTSLWLVWHPHIKLYAVGSGQRVQYKLCIFDLH